MFHIFWYVYPSWSYIYIHGLNMMHLIYYYYHMIIWLLITMKVYYYYHMIIDYYHMSITIITIIWIYYYYRMFLPMYGVSLLVNLRSFFSSPRMWSNGIPSVSRSANTCKADDMTTFCRVILGKPLVVNDGFYICIIINMYIYIWLYM